MYLESIVHNVDTITTHRRLLDTPLCTILLLFSKKTGQFRKPKI